MRALRSRSVVVVILTLAAAGCGSSTSRLSLPPSSRVTTATTGVSTATTAVSTTTIASTTAPPTSRVIHPTTTLARTTTTVAPSQKPCQIGALAVAITSDKATYTSGEIVTIKVTVTNVSRQPCSVANPYPPAATLAGSPVTILDSGGTPVWSPLPCCPGVAAIVPPLPLSGTGSYTWATVQWDQHRCTDPCRLDSSGAGEGPLVMPGNYEVTAPAPSFAAPPLALMLTITT